jgi:hypothetical protein
MRSALISRIATVLFAVALLPALNIAASAKVMQAPGSRVSFDLPENFKSSPLFAGFMEIVSSAAVIVLELPPEAYDRVAAGFTAEALAKKGVKKVKKGKLDRTDDYLYLTGEQKHPRATFEKFILVLRDAKNTAVVTFNVPRGSFTNASIKREAVIKAMTTAKLEEKAAPSHDLFKLGYLGPFELAGSPTGTSRIYMEKGASGPKDTRNLMVIAPSLNRLPIKNIQEFSQYALQSLKNSKNLKIADSNDITVDNMAGHLLKATAKRGADDTDILIRQLILLPAAGGYFRVLAITKAADDARIAPELEKVFASFKALEHQQAQ